ncbi:MAG: glycoside hydrolase family 92 protein [Saprospiraceae bacterium]|nr:glycoside hydrolase family 92 protein [Saprospiraceae bacterium]
MEIEIPHWDFDEVVNATGKTWSSSLDKFQIQGANEDQKTIFYTALFHTMLFPREFSEYGQYYSPFDDKFTRVCHTMIIHSGTLSELHPLLLLRIRKG